MNKSRVIDIIIAVIAGIAIWAYVVSVLDPVSSGTIKAVPVQLTNAEAMASSGLAIAGTGEYTVDVVVTANRSTLNALTSDDFIASADVSHLTKGQNYISVEVIAPTNVSVSEVRTQNIQVYVDTAVKVEKSVVIVSSNLPDGYELGSVRKSVDSVFVSGAASLVDSVADVQALIDVGNMTLDEPVTNEYTLTAVDSDGNRVYGVTLSEPSVTIDSCLYALKEVALNVSITGELNEHISVRSEIVPASVIIKGPGDLLADIWQIEADPIDKSTVTESCSIPLNIILPAGTERAEASAYLAVYYELKGRVEKTVSIGPDNIEAAGLDEKLELSGIQSYEMIFSLYDDQAEAFSPESVKLSIDCSAAAVGPASLPYSFVFDESFEDVIVISAPETIDLEIIDPANEVDTGDGSD